MTATATIERCPAECPVDCSQRARCDRDEADDLDFGFDLGAALGDDEDPWAGPNVLCPKCEGEAVPLGALGKLMWYRCRDCGIDFNGRVD